MSRRLKRVSQVLAVAFLIGAPLFWNDGALRRGAVAIAEEAIRDPMGLLAMRSPGSRAAGALFQTKQRHVAKRAMGPHERVLSQERAPEPAPSLAPEINLPAELADEPPVTDGPQIVLPGTTPTTIVTPQKTPAPPAPPVVPTGVPEPSTWLSMILGMAFIGAAMRRRPDPDRGTIQ